MKDCNKIPSVENFITPAGNKIPNQFKIYCNDFVIFQSYTSTIAIKYYDGRVVLGTNWDYSTTTGKYRNEFLGEGIAVTREKIENGTYMIDESL